MQSPESRYVKTRDGVHLAYQVVGEGPLDLVFLPGLFTHLEYQWEEPSSAKFLERLAAFSRLILFDPRGTGLSDRAPELPIADHQMDDVNAVLDVIGSERAALLGLSQGGPMAALYAATYPQRVSALILYGSYPSARVRPDFPWGRSAEWLEDYARTLDQAWGMGALLPTMAPSRADDPAFRDWWARYERLSSAPGNALAYYRMNVQTDVRHVLPTIRLPTLLLHRRDDAFRPIETSRYMAEQIPDAKLVELEGVDHLPFVGDSQAVVDEIQEFLTGVRSPPESDRVLATVLFTDIVGSTQRVAELGDREWTDLLERHHRVVRRHLQRFRGRDVDTAGDGFLATFDGPARAIKCAVAIGEEIRELGMEIRAGLHTGEVELVGSDVRGIAVHIGARVAALAGPGEVLVSNTVRDLVAGSGIDFEDRGSHTLKGVPGEWEVLAVATAP